MKPILNPLLGLVALLLTWSLAQATEGGASSYPMGAENYLAGALPPPGFYVLMFVSRYSADELKDDAGRNLPINFKVTANAISPRFVWVTSNTLFGGQVAHAVIIPLVNLDVRVNGTSQNKTGVGDFTFTPLALGYHHSLTSHSVLAVDVIAPAGQYNRNNLANVGRNYWAVQPVYVFSHIDPAGWNFDAKIMYDINFKNADTHYKSGRELHTDYAIGYGVAKNWVTGVGGYWYHQVSDDMKNGIAIGNRGRVFAIGPSIKYDNGKGFFITAKFQHEMHVRNRSEGDAFWIKTIIPY